MESGTDRSGRRHCWVVLDDDVEPMPGVVAAWEHTGGGWMARVAYVLDDTGTVMSGRLSASYLRPHPPGPPSPRPPAD